MSMVRLRITAISDPNNPSDELRRLDQLRRDLYAYSPVEVDPDNPAFHTHRDQEENVYFEFSTEYRPEVDRVLRQFGHEGCVRVAEVEGPVGEPCSNCGYIAGPLLPAECPQCHFRDISRCPRCAADVPREEYESIAGDLFRCPRCGNRVRLRFNEPFVLPDGRNNEPIVLVECAF